MSMELQLQLEFILRIVISGVCGALIGYERKSRNKEAGIRTHLIVASGAALMMIISKYGFSDILGNKGIALDPSRIAAQIVTGVGFLGAGMIFMRRNTISGLTTAAGLWTTSGIGMAMGCGLYIIAISTSLFIITIQVILHGNHRWFHEPYKDEVSFLVCKDKVVIEYLSNQLKQMHIDILNIRIQEQQDMYKIHMSIIYPDRFDFGNFVDFFKKCDFVKEMDV